MCNSIGSGHWLAVHYDCVLWGSGSTLLFASPREKQEPEATRANSRYETNTGFSHCGNLNLSLDGQDFFPRMKKPAIGRETSPFPSCVSLYLPPCCLNVAWRSQFVLQSREWQWQCVCFCFFMKTNKPRSSKVLSLISHVKSKFFSSLRTQIFMALCVLQPNTDSDSWQEPHFFPSLPPSAQPQTLPQYFL